MDTIKQALRVVRDFPKEGIAFVDIAPVLSDPDLFASVIDALSEDAKVHGATHIAALDARGFIFGAALAYALGVPFAPIRKAGKLPGECHKISYDLEYGSASMELQKDACTMGDRVYLLDDLLATGGSMLAAAALVRACGADIVRATCVIELPQLFGRARLKADDLDVHTFVRM